MSNLIAIHSPAPQSGKSLVATFISDAYECEKLSFALPIKRMLGSIMPHVLAKMELPQDYLYGAKKQHPIEALGGVDARRLMQTLGTDWGRKMIHPDIWVNIWKGMITEALDKGYTVVTDDMRFPNEMAAVKALGGVCWWVERPGAVNTYAHDSEGQLDSMRDKFDVIIINNGTVEQLQEQVLLAAHQSLGPA